MNEQQKYDVFMNLSHQDQKQFLIQWGNHLDERMTQGEFDFWVNAEHNFTKKESETKIFEYTATCNTTYEIGGNYLYLKIGDVIKIQVISKEKSD